MNLQNLNVAELSAQEVMEIEGGGCELPGVPWWYYFVAPGSAYITDKFIEGYNSTCPED